MNNKANKTSYKKGHSQTNTGQTHFKKGIIPWNKGNPCQYSKGKNHWNWKGGTSRIYKNGYYSTEYINWRKEVFQRDDYTCQDCGKKEFITAHHIKSFAKYQELRFKISNGITLCENCHSLIDNYRARFKRRQSAAEPAEQEGSETSGEQAIVLNNHISIPHLIGDEIVRTSK